MRLTKLCALALLALSAAPAARAQFSQYTKSGDFERSPELLATQVRTALEEAKWDWGGFRVDPWLALREITYDDNVDGRSRMEESDFTATLGAGLRGYLPVGEDLVLAAHLLPEYVWWKDLSDRRRINGRGGIGLFGNVGRTALEASVQRTDEARFYSREFEDQVNTSDEAALLSLAVDLSRGFKVFGSASLARLSFRDEDQDLSAVRTLDRDETILRAGVTYDGGRGVQISVGVEDSEADFEAVDSIRNNSGTSPLVRLEFDNSELYGLVELVDRELEFDQLPQVDYSDVTGKFRLEWDPSERLGLQGWWRNGLVYSFTDRWAYFEEKSVGLGLTAALTSRLGARAYAESGEMDYQVIESTIPERIDDFDTYGLQFEFKLRRATLRLDASTTDYTSSLPEFDRDVTIVRSGLIFGSGSLSPWG